MEQLEIKGSRLRLICFLCLVMTAFGWLKPALRGDAIDPWMPLSAAGGAAIFSFLLPKRDFRVGIRHGWLYGPGSWGKQITVGLHDLDVERSRKLSLLGDRVLWSRQGHNIRLDSMLYPRGERQRLEQALGLSAKA